MAETTTHIGRKISRLRELRGMKQETLAEQLGISQQAVSKMEQSEQVEDLTLERVAKALGLTKEAIQKYSDEAVVNFFNTFNDSSVNQGANYHSIYNINPIDKWIEALEENKKLYEALLKSEREKVALLEKMIEKLEKK